MTRFQLSAIVLVLFSTSALMQPAFAGHKQHGNHSKAERHHYNDSYGKHKHKRRHKHHHSWGHQHRRHYGHYNHYCRFHSAYHLNHLGHHVSGFIGGLAVGAILHAGSHRDDDDYRQPAAQNNSQPQQAPVIYRQTKNGKCFQVFYNAEGDENLVPVDKSYCGG